MVEGTEFLNKKDMSLGQVITENVKISVYKFFWIINTIFHGKLFRI